MVAFGYALAIGGAVLFCATVISLGLSLFIYARFREFLKVYLSAPFAGLIFLAMAMIGFSMTGLPDPPYPGFKAIFWAMSGLFGFGAVLGLVIRTKLGPMVGPSGPLANKQTDIAGRE